MIHSINTDDVLDIFQKGSYLNYVIADRGGLLQIIYCITAVLFIVINPLAKHNVNFEDF